MTDVSSAVEINAEADVSVVVPCFCCADTLDRAINSVLAQTMLPKELILVDDASCDATLVRLNSWRNRYPNFIQVVALPSNQGAGMARNAGWSIAKGKYIAFLDSDDAWHPKKIAIQFTFMDANPDVFLSGHGHSIGVEYEVDASFKPNAANVQWWQLLIKNPFVTPSVMVLKSVQPRFHDSQRYMEDHLLWMELALSRFRVICLEVPLAILYKNQVGVAGLSSHIRAMSKADLGNYLELYRKNLLGFPTLLLCLSWACVKFLRRTLIFWVPRTWRRWRQRVDA